MEQTHWHTHKENRTFKGQKLLTRYVMDCSIRLFHFHTWTRRENHQRTNAKPSHSQFGCCEFSIPSAGAPPPVASFSISVQCKYLCWCKESAELTTSSRTLSKPFIAKESHHHHYTSLESALMLKSNVRYQSYKSLLDWANFIYFQPYQLIYYLARSKRLKGLCVSPISRFDVELSN